MYAYSKGWNWKRLRLPQRRSSEDTSKEAGPMESIRASNNESTRSKQGQSSGAAEVCRSMERCGAVGVSGVVIILPILGQHAGKVPTSLLEGSPVIATMRPHRPVLHPIEWQRFGTPAPAYAPANRTAEMLRNGSWLTLLTSLFFCILLPRAGVKHPTGER